MVHVYKYLLIIDIILTSKIIFLFYKDIPTSLTAINIKFTNPNAHTTESYTVSDVHIPITFTLDSGSTVVNDDLGNPWLSIAPTTIETVIIQDFNSLSTITISRYPEQLYNLQVSEYGCTFC